MMETVLRKFGNSLGLVVPKGIRQVLGLSPGQTVSIVQKGNTLIIKPLHKKRYRLEELINQCDLSAPDLCNDIWDDAPPTGKEIW
jgi:antitoxin ChpS